MVVDELAKRMKCDVYCERWGRYEGKEYAEEAGAGSGR